jgi:hypothetical protein
LREQPPVHVQHVDNEIVVVRGDVEGVEIDARPPYVGGCEARQSLVGDVQGVHLEPVPRQEERVAAAPRGKIERPWARREAAEPLHQL